MVPLHSPNENEIGIRVIRVRRDQFRMLYNIDAIMGHESHESWVFKLSQYLLELSACN